MRSNFKEQIGEDEDIADGPPDVGVASNDVDNAIANVNHLAPE